MDREKVVKGLECCADSCRHGCPYADDDDCESALCADALALLKEQAERIQKYERVILEYEDKEGILF